MRRWGVTGHPWLDVVIGVAVALILVWVLLVVALMVRRPRGHLLSESLRLLPDLLRMLGRVAADRSQPTGIRVRLGLLMLYLALPIDVVPDFIPILGYADDAILVILVLRSVARRAGIETLRHSWPGTDDGFAAVCRLTGLPQHARGTTQPAKPPAP